MKRIGIMAKTFFVWGLTLLLVFALVGPAAAQSWKPTGNLNVPRQLHTATLLLDGRVLVAGGSNISGFALNSAELYDPATGTWTPTDSMANARAVAATVRLQDGRVLVISGGDQSGSLPSAEIYDPSTGGWTATGPMYYGRRVPTATLLPDGKVLVAGGHGYPTWGYLNTAELYNPATNTWSQTGSMAMARSHHTATLLPDGKVLVAGGEDTAHCWPCSLQSAEIYNPCTGLWTPTGSLNQARAAHTANLLLDGRVLVVGGVVQAPGVSSSLDTAELYDPGTGVWTSTVNNLLNPRDSFTSVRLIDGTVLVAGGLKRGEGALNGAELYDPATGLWASVESLNQARYYHTTTLLSDGTVLVAGGSDGTQELNTAEIFGAVPVTTSLCPVGEVAVAVLTTDDFDAANINEVSVEFGEASPKKCELKDVDNDGDADLLCNFKTKEIDISDTIVEAALTGETSDGTLFGGTDSISIAKTCK
jgi:N-acetylneuraminic acid mutarotase